MDHNRYNIGMDSLPAEFDETPFPEFIESLEINYTHTPTDVFEYISQICPEFIFAPPEYDPKEWVCFEAETEDLIHFREYEGKFHNISGYSYESNGIHQLIESGAVDQIASTIKIIEEIEAIANTNIDKERILNGYKINYKSSGNHLCQYVITKETSGKKLQTRLEVIKNAQGEIIAYHVSYVEKQDNRVLNMHIMFVDIALDRISIASSFSKNEMQFDQEARVLNLEVLFIENQIRQLGKRKNTK